MTISRREFVKGIGGVGLASVLGGCGGSAPTSSSGGSTPTTSATPTETPRPAADPWMRPLGRTDLVLSAVGFGAQRTSDPNLIRYALDQGINHIESAWAYGGGMPGNNCEVIGKAIAGRRDTVCLSIAFHSAFPRTSRGWVDNQMAQVLRDLGTEFIDVFLWVYEDNNAIAARCWTGEAVDLMLKWKQEGKIRWCGVTTHDQQALWMKNALQTGFYDVAVVAFNEASPPGIAAAMQSAAQQGLGLIAMKTQSPNYLKGQSIGDAPDHRKALDYVLRRDFVTAAIPGMTTREQVELNVQVMRALTARPS